MKLDRLKNLYILLGIVFVLWLTSIFIIPKFFSELSDRGTFGDSFGVINSLFSGFAFAGIIYTILLQRKELSLQREELVQTRKELARSASAQERSEKQQKRQSENLKITAKLNALNSLLTFALNKESNARNEVGKASARLEQEKYVKRIQEILDKKEV